MYTNASCCQRIERVRTKSFSYLLLCAWLSILVRWRHSYFADLWQCVLCVTGINVCARHFRCRTIFERAHSPMRVRASCLWCGTAMENLHCHMT